MRTLALAGILAMLLESVVRCFEVRPRLSEVLSIAEHPEAIMEGFKKMVMVSIPAVREVGPITTFLVIDWRLVRSKHLGTLQTF